MIFFVGQKNISQLSRTIHLETYWAAFPLLILKSVSLSIQTTVASVL